MSESEGRNDAVTSDDTGEATKDANEAKGEGGQRPTPRVRTSDRLPRAQEISGSAHFTPHGLSRRRVPRNPKALSAAARRRRRLKVALLAVGLVLGVAAGVGNYLLTRPPTEIIVTGAFGKKPTITLPKVKPSGTLQSRYLIEGNGPAVRDDSLVVAHYVAYAWRGESSERVLNSYEEGKPESLVVSGLIPGLRKGLTGKKVGSRVLLSIPPKEGFGEKGSAGRGVQAKDTLVFVIDLLTAYGKESSASGTTKKVDGDLPKVTDKGKGVAPEVKIPDTDPPDDLKAETLIEGTGPAVAKGQRIVAHYVGRVWRNGKVFDSSYEAKGPERPAQPVMFPIGTGQVVSGWDKGLVGKKVGSRVLLVLPPKEGYGKEGNPLAGIKGDDTLVFVVDILGVH